MSGNTPSPCVEGCNYDKDLGFCKDCGRTLTEIADWSILPTDRKREVKHDAKVRKNGVKQD